MNKKQYLSIVSHYESCLEEHGDNHKGVDWPDKKDAIKRYDVMLDLIKDKASPNISLLDFGCGSSHMYDHILDVKLSNITYSGLDISNEFIKLSRKKNPSLKYYCLDILDQNIDIGEFDYILMNGVFTEKRELSFEEMVEYYQKVIGKVFDISRIGIAFNVMSSHVDWERDDLFHLPLDVLCSFLINNISRNFIVRNDYGLYEYTVYVYK